MFRATPKRIIGIVTAMLSLASATFAQAMPTAEAFQRVVDEAHAEFKDVTEGANANYIPILDTVPSELFGVAIVTNDGQVFTAGDVDYRFSIQSVSKPFTAALIMAQQGPEAVREKIGVEPTGLPFNSKVAIEMYDDRSVNPLVNAGAIAAVSLVEAENEDERWRLVHENIEGFAGEDLPVLE
jgi:glutaminase